MSKIRRKFGLLGYQMASLGLVAAVVVAAGVMLSARPVAAAACAPLPATKGTVTASVNFATAGSYRAWVRLMAPSATANGVYLQVADAGACQVTVGKTSLPVNQLNWVGWQNGSTTSFIDLTVPAGAHEVVLAGLDDGVGVDQVIFLSDKACTPTGDGSNCKVEATPTATMTPTPAKTPSPVPTPTPVGDVQPPTAPAGLATTAQTDTTIALSWGAATDNVGVTGYRVKRNGAQVGTATARTYTDAGLAPNKAYSYTVTAVDAAGNESPASAALVATTKPAPDTIAPTAPTAAAAKANSPTSATITWAAATDNVAVTGYYVLRNGVTLAQPTGLSYTDATAVAGTTYSYVIKARDAAGNVSAGSNAATVTMPQPADTQAPSTPAGLVAKATSSNQVNLSWSAATDNVGVAGYSVRRNGQELAKVTTTVYGDTSVLPSTTYQYTVVAYDAAGNNGTASAVAGVTTPAADTYRLGGLLATYYDNLNFTGASLNRVDPTVNFNWGDNAPMASMGRDTFSVRWSGRIHAPATGTFKFYTRSDDGVRLWIDGKRIVNNWGDHAATENSGSVTLTAGHQYDIRMEYFENKGKAVSRLQWSGPTVRKQVVPSNVLYHQ